MLSLEGAWVKWMKELSEMAFNFLVTHVWVVSGLLELLCEKQYQHLSDSQCSFCVLHSADFSRDVSRRSLKDFSIVPAS